MFGIFGSIAEFERELNRDWVRSSLAAAIDALTTKGAKGCRDSYSNVNAVDATDHS